MRDLVLQAWHGMVLAGLMGVITLMMVTGVGARRGTWLNRLRISLWSAVIVLGGMAGCSTTSIRGEADATDTADDVETRDTADEDGIVITCYEDVSDAATDDGTVDTSEEEPIVDCYFAGPIDPGPDAPEDVEEETD